MRDVRIDDQLVRDNERMLTDGFYAEVTLAYDGIIAQEKGGRPFGVSSLRPIQMSKSDVLDIYAKARRSFTTAEWIDFLLRSIGLEPAAFNERAKRVVLLRWSPSSSETTTSSSSGHAAPAKATYSSRYRRMPI